MDKKSLIDKVKGATSPVDMLALRPDILAFLGETSETDSRRKELMSLKMDELREIGNRYGAKDTSKSELVDEIIRKEGS